MLIGDAGHDDLLLNQGLFLLGHTAIGNGFARLGDDRCPLGPRTIGGLMEETTKPAADLSRYGTGWAMPLSDVLMPASHSGSVCLDADDTILTP